MRKNRVLQMTVPVILVTTFLAGCGTANTTVNQTPAKSSTTSTSSRSTKSGQSGAVTTVNVNKAALVLQGSKSAHSTSNEATFTITATGANGQPVANQPVTFYIGPMKPLSGVPPKAWYVSGTNASSAYIATYSKMTNAKGQATVVLYGQPADSMEMIGFRVGDVSSYDSKAKHAIGSMDAWWTSCTSHATAPIGDYVTVSPFLSTGAAMSSEKVSIGVFSPNGPITNANVSVIAKNSSNSMSGMMSSDSTKLLKTDAKGIVSTMISTPKTSNRLPIRIVITKSTGKGRIAGGINAEWIKN